MYQIPADLLQAVVNYLAEKPFNEVAPMVTALTQLQQVVEAPIDPPEDGDLEVDFENDEDEVS